MRTPTPYAFANGFLAQRIAREQHQAFPKAEIEVVQVQNKGHAKKLRDGSFIWVGEQPGFLVKKTEGDEVTFYAGLEDGFIPIPEDTKEAENGSGEGDPA
jgi:hypothetical protein